VLLVADRHAAIESCEVVKQCLKLKMEGRDWRVKDEGMKEWARDVNGSSFLASRPISSSKAQYELTS